MEKVIGEYITATLLGSGYAAVHVVTFNSSEFGIYNDIHQTGIGRYKTKEEAEIEAKQWAKAEEIEFK